MGAEGVERLFEQLHHHIRLEAHAEVTLEANPEDVSPAAVAAWRPRREPTGHGTTVLHA